MIVRDQEAKKKDIKGISLEVLAVGEKSMITRVHLKPGDRIPSHSHPNEQSGYMVSGRMRLKFGEFDEVLEPGDSYTIPGGMEHSADALEESMVIDFFVPPRDDYR